MRAPDAVRDLGGSPGGCNGTGRLWNGPVLEEAGFGIGRPDYHNRTAAAIIEIRLLIDGAMPVVRPRGAMGGPAGLFARSGYRPRRMRRAPSVGAQQRSACACALADADQRGCGLGDLGDLCKTGLSSDCGLGGLIWVNWVIRVV